MMTVPQKKYFCNRIDEITETKVRALVNTLVQNETDKNICIQGLEEGKIEVRGISEIKKIIVKSFLAKSGYNSSYMPNIGIEKFLKGYEQYQRKYLHQQSVAGMKIDNKVKLLRHKATEVKDVAMFGTEVEAHKTLAMFIKFNV